MSLTNKKPIQIVLVDRNDKVLGYKEKFEVHHNPVPLHRAVSVLIYEKSQQKMLLQKRSSNKPTWPGFWANACCTHPLPDEAYKDAAERRLDEEMGIRIPLKTRSLKGMESGLKEVFRFVYKAKYDETWGEHEYDVVFVGNYKGSVKPDPKEAEDHKWMKIPDLMRDIKENPNIYTPWFKLILSRLH